MKIPGSRQAVIPEAKLTDYLLSESHPVGKSKARFLRTLGFDQKNADQLRQALLSIAHTEDVTETQDTAHGVKYIVIGQVTSPRGEQVRLQTVWIIETGQEAPRFVTADPV